MFKCHLIDCDYRLRYCATIESYWTFVEFWWPVNNRGRGETWQQSKYHSMAANRSANGVRPKRHDVYCTVRTAVLCFKGRETGRREAVVSVWKGKNKKKKTTTTMTMGECLLMDPNGGGQHSSAQSTSQDSSLFFLSPPFPHYSLSISPMFKENLDHRRGRRLSSPFFRARCLCVFSSSSFCHRWPEQQGI